MRVDHSSKPSADLDAPDCMSRHLTHSGTKVSEVARSRLLNVCLWQALERLTPSYWKILRYLQVVQARLIQRSLSIHQRVAPDASTLKSGCLGVLSPA